MNHDYSKLVKPNGRTDYIWGFMEDSAEIIEKVEPLLLPLLKTKKHTYKLYSVEGDKNDAFKLFVDICCGIDYFIVRDDHVPYSLSARTQKISDGGRLYNSFTVREERNNGAKTEFAKYKKAKKEGGIYPQRMLQVYYEEDTKKILSFALAKTSDIIKYIEDGNSYVKAIPGDGPDGQMKFWVVEWEDFQKQGYNIVIYPEDLKLKEVKEWKRASTIAIQPQDSSPATSANGLTKSAS